VAIDREDPVFVCAGCGRGFVRHPGCKMDPYPAWAMLEPGPNSESGGACLGAVTLAYRSQLIRNLDNAENDRKDR